MPTTPSNNSTRISSMDALRALAMFLGVILHACMAYTVRKFDGFYHDPVYSNGFYDILFFAIHVFRMPLFYVIAGFFFRLLYFRIGQAAFIKHRTQRIFYPFIVGLFTILPLTYLPDVYYRISNGGSHFTNPDLVQLVRDIFIWRGPLHLWFLYYLLLFYIAGIVLYKLAGPYLKKKSPFSRFVQLEFKPPFIPPALVLLTFLSLLLFDTAVIQFAPGLMPSAAFISYYGLFFYYGWLLHKHMTEYFPLLRKYCLLFILIGCGVAGYVYKEMYSTNYLPNEAVINTPLMKVGMSVVVISLVLGLLGVFLRWVNAENPVIRYLSDASYWVYLVHVALVNAVELWIGRTNIWGPAKFMLCVGIPLTISLITYQWFVRYTVIGYYLHGARKKQVAISLKERSG